MTRSMRSTDPSASILLWLISMPLNLHHPAGIAQSVVYWHVDQVVRGFNPPACYFFIHFNKHLQIIVQISGRMFCSSAIVPYGGTFIPMDTSLLHQRLDQKVV